MEEQRYKMIRIEKHQFQTDLQVSVTQIQVREIRDRTRYSEVCALFERKF